MTYIDNERNIARTEAIIWIRELQQLGARKLFLKNKNIRQAFRGSETLTCGDEGITFGIHSPGSGVLLSDDMCRRMVQRAEITELTGHDNCGAFALAFPNIAKEDRNRVCREYNKGRANVYGLSYRHLTAEEMNRPKTFHNAVAIYYDGTGEFNRIEGLPPGFVISRYYSPAAEEELKRYMTIAMGNDGLGSFFSTHTPLHVIALAHPTDRQFSLKRLQQEIYRVAKGHGNRVVIDGVKTSWFFYSREMESTKNESVPVASSR